MSGVKNTISFSLIKNMNYADYYEERLDLRPPESNETPLMIQSYF